MIHKHRKEDILNFIRKHPGLTVERISLAFGTNVKTTLRRLQQQGQVTIRYLFPEFRKKKKKIYFPKEK